MTRTALAAGINPALTPPPHTSIMVIRPRIRSFLMALALYCLAGLFIGYFGVNAYTGKNGLKARQGLDQQIADLARELDGIKTERARWERRVALLKSDQIDPDMLDERARLLLEYADPRDVTIMVKQRPSAPR